VWQRARKKKKQVYIERTHLEKQALESEGHVLARLIRIHCGHVKHSLRREE
jgi:hypothetical protein